MNKKSTAFALPCVKYEYYIAIMRATECINFVIEVTNIETKSNFFVSVVLDEKYEKRQKKKKHEYVDIVFNARLNSEFEETISNIIKAKPEIISIYCSFSSRTEYNSLQLDGDIILEFLLDENVFILSCDCELYESLQLRIRNLLI